VCLENQSTTLEGGRESAMNQRPGIYIPILEIMSTTNCQESYFFIRRAVKLGCSLRHRGDDSRLGMRRPPNALRAGAPRWQETHCWRFWAFFPRLSAPQRNATMALTTNSVSPCRTPVHQRGAALITRCWNREDRPLVHEDWACYIPIMKVISARGRRTRIGPQQSDGRSAWPG
jgi:hypothetical protein